ncbi:MOSC domain-containing protein [Sulfitobacter sp. S190]|uniref:MOSC domain-containing protein n=1 Tax=Sulfitobacter sp. S190 TaxID=2867022 RepID=UPI0021A88BEB|nr:MOSC domain-containing protein [Sulfitobacter sp. S190]UWR23006.1 MOSC domain-containing protein [Sulfitobacter sp. S190]
MQITALWRHPIKSHGREALDRVTLGVGTTLPYDRTWAVAHDAASADGSEWAACQNFNRGAKSPALMAITARLDEDTETVTLHHPDLPELVAHPDRDGARIVAWSRPLSNPDRAAPARVVRLRDRGFTDTPFASISLCNIATHAAVEQLADSPLQPERWRGNIWFDGASAWDEFEWIGRDLKLGTARVRVEERITRCLATTVNTDTGVRDVDTLGALKQLGHQDFGIYVTVTKAGDVAVGDRLELI